jgi:ABC-type bacteriocin/lantibiotic exporter with double-glycine peptidase domain
MISGIAEKFGIATPAEMVMPLAIIFALAAIVAGTFRLLLLWVGLRLGNVTGADLGLEIFHRTLYQPYSVHVTRNSSEIISTITQKVGAATNVLISGVSVFTSGVLFLAIIMTLLLKDPVIAIVAFISFGVAYILIARQTSKRLVTNSKKIADEQTYVVKALQEGLGAIRDVLIEGTQSVYSNLYKGAIYKLQRASAENIYINQAPRYAMEALGLVLIAIFALVLSTSTGGINGALPILAMLALGAQRLLPLMQQLFGGWATLKGSLAAILDVIDLLEQPVSNLKERKEISPIHLNNSIRFDNVSFRYSYETPIVLDGVDLSIEKGTTGGGKSTLMDLLLGLLEPSDGSILIDGVPLQGSNIIAWQQSVAHVPQHIFLSDGTISENIAFGTEPEQIDEERVRIAAEQANLSDFIDSRPMRYQERIGERGIRLSGGQRQRIGIARALYKRADVLIFDEATSALDTDTENNIIRTIESLDRDFTILIIAHRISTLENCDKFLLLERGKIRQDLTFQDLLQRKQA